MVSSSMKMGIQRTVVTLGMALILIGVVLLTVSDKAFILGICFLAVGCLTIFCYLILNISSCITKANRRQDEESETQTPTTNTRQPQPQTEINAAQFEAPRYEDVILCGSATVWTVTLSPGLGPETEPPPYSALDSGKRRAIGELRLPRPALLRISSDIHEFKGVINQERHLEPLTPPPNYNEAMQPWEDVFEPAQ